MVPSWRVLGFIVCALGPSASGPAQLVEVMLETMLEDCFTGLDARGRDRAQNCFRKTIGKLRDSGGLGLGNRSIAQGSVRKGEKLLQIVVASIKKRESRCDRLMVFRSLS